MKFVTAIVAYILLFPVFSHAENILVVKKAVKTTNLTGYTRGAQSLTVTSEVSGKVLKVNFDVGQTISNKAFIEIDPTFIDFEIRNTEQSLHKLEIILKRIRSRVAYLEKEFMRVDTLHKGDRATEVKRDAAAQEHEQAQLELDATLQERTILQTTLKELKERRTRHNIHAPQGWIVTERKVEPGEVIQPGVPLAKVSNYRELIVPLSVSGEELSAIRSLPKAFDALLENRKVRASVNWVNPEFDEKTRKLKIELVIKNFSGERRGGLKFTLPVQIPTEGVLVPIAAVTRRYENPFVTVKKTGEKVNLIILGTSGRHLIVAEDERITPGTKLVSAFTESKSSQ